MGAKGSFENELKEIYSEFERLDKSSFSWRKVKEIYNNFEEKYSNAKKEEITEDIEIARLMFFGEIHQCAYEFMARRLVKGEDKLPSIDNEELDFIQEIAEKGSQMLDLLEGKTLPENRTQEQKDFFSRIKRDNEELKAYIQQERKKRGFSTPKNSNNKTNSSQPPQNTQQVQNLQNEINSLNQKLNEITNLVQELLAKQNQNKPITETEKKEIQQKLSGLQEQKEQVQTQLTQKQTQKEELTKQPENTQQPDKEFNWWYVVIPLGGLLLIAGIIIAYLLGKNKKKD